MAKWMIEIFEATEKSSKPVQVLEENRNNYLNQFIDIMKKGVDWDLPETDPPYKTNDQLPLGNADLTIYNAIRRFYLFHKGTKIAKNKKEMLFIQMLEGLHPKEAQLILDLKNGAIPVKYPNLWKAVGGKPVVEEAPVAEPAVEPAVEKPKAVRKPRAKKVVDPDAPKKRPGRPKKVVDPSQ